MNTKKEAHAAGASWVLIKIEHADGSCHSLQGAFTRADAIAIIVGAEERPNPLNVQKEEKTT